MSDGPRLAVLVATHDRGTVDDEHEAVGGITLAQDHAARLDVDGHEARGEAGKGVDGALAEECDLLEPGEVDAHDPPTRTTRTWRNSGSRNQRSARSSSLTSRRASIRKPAASSARL